MTDPTEEDAEKARGAIERMLQHSDDALERLRDCIQANVLCCGTIDVQLITVDSNADYGSESHFAFDVSGNKRTCRVLVRMSNQVGQWTLLAPAELEIFACFLLSNAIALSNRYVFPEEPL